MSSLWHRPDGGDVWIMGVLNCTPDSFSDGGGDFLDASAAVARGLSMWECGAAIIDVGGESTRPGATPVATDEELGRVIPVVDALAAQGCRVSIDTMKAEVMRQAIAAGASIVNDVSALRGPDSLEVVAAADVDVCLMHMQGTPESMQDRPQYGDVLSEVLHFFEARIEACLEAGIAESRILLDPGIGFGKRLEDNLSLIRGIGEIKRRFSMPVLLGVSRKSFLGTLTGSPVEEREIETAVAGSFGIFVGADMLRVHDVVLQKKAVRVASALAASVCNP